MDSVVFLVTAGGNERFFAIDNIVVDGVNRVPEPGSIALVGLALTGLGLRSRNSRPTGHGDFLYFHTLTLHAAGGIEVRVVGACSACGSSKQRLPP